jgi:hypothetical protein
MASAAWQGGFGVTVERARKLAEALDLKTESDLANLQLDTPRQLFTQIRAYLQRRTDGMNVRNNPHRLLRLYPSNGFAQIDLGPTIDKGPTPEHFSFDSGARLSFGLTLREVEDGSQVVSYRYHFVFPDGQSPQYLRFDMRDAPHPDPLIEPRCHLHPGIDDVRIPFSVHHPIEILDRIFFGLERVT